ncbi:MAG: 3',5'-cyclic adenosine monophosphate phosphodiesterase CpdA [Phycisphaerae bacterium]|nr:3',5'-cyclic adenosine monophosphate phosphodiesterase CpdA [Phycisphaerae bacterium]
MSIVWTTPGAHDVSVRYRAGEEPEREAADLKYDSVEYRPWNRWSYDDASRPGQIEVICRADLGGLTPGTLYRYRVQCGGESAEGTFRTFPAAAPASFTFGVYGDSRSDPEVHRQIADELAAAHPAFVLHTGDLVSAGMYDEYRGQFFDPGCELFASVPILPTPGNHEGAGDAYLKLFHLPGRGGRYYSFDYGNAHFVSLDSMNWEADEMLEWLARDLAASRADWKIVYYHYPTYDVGSHQSDWGRDDVAPVLRRGGVDVVIAGHSHTYQRFKPMFTAGENRKHPITYMVVAGGGAPLYSVEGNLHTAVAVSEYNYVLVTVAGRTLSAVATGLDGGQIDRFSIAKQADGSFVPSCLAAAMDEADFDRIGKIIAGCFDDAKVDKLPPAGQPIPFRVRLGAGQYAMKFRVELTDYAAESYAMDPVEGSSLAGGTAELDLSIRPLQGVEPWASTLNGRIVPMIDFRIVYEIEGTRGSCYSMSIGTGGPPPTQP